jgi:hypothetical protein
MCPRKLLPSGPSPTVAWTATAEDTRSFAVTPVTRLPTLRPRPNRAGELTRLEYAAVPCHEEVRSVAAGADAEVGGVIASCPRTKGERRKRVRKPRPEALDEMCFTMYLLGVPLCEEGDLNPHGC